MKSKFKIVECAGGVAIKQGNTIQVFVHTVQSCYEKGAGITLKPGDPRRMTDKQAKERAKKIKAFMDGGGA